MNAQDPTMPINNHLVGAILCTLFCFLPFGVVAIVNASNVNTQISLGNIKAAQIYADKAKCWVKWSILTSIIGGILILAFYIALFCFSVGAGMRMSNNNAPYEVINTEIIESIEVTR